MAYVDTIATHFICYTSVGKNKIIRKDSLERIIETVNAEYSKRLQVTGKSDIDFHKLWNPAIQLVVPNIDLFGSKEYRSILSRYYTLRKAAKSAQYVKSSKLTVEKSGKFRVKIFVNDAVSLIFTTTKQLGKVKYTELTEEPRVLRAHITKPLNPRIYNSARKKASAAMNKFRKK